MAVLTLRVAGEDHRLEFRPGPSLRDILDATDYRVRSACLGLGACGLCQVRLLAGDGGPITAAERLQLGEAAVSGLRLACQCRPAGDVAVALTNPVAVSDWRSPPPGLVDLSLLAGPADRPLPAGVAHPLGAAVDLGTSHITVAVCDLATGRPLALRFGRNPQGGHGADIVTRLVAAEDPAAARQLAMAARGAIGAALADVATREGLDLGRIARVAVVANTAMLTLLADRNHGLLLRPSHWTETVDCSPVDSDAWVRAWGIAAGADVELVPPLGGFVGSDLLAGIVACGLVAGPAPALLVDFGTNSEIALWTGETLWVTASAGGPAFEAGAGRCGMPAEAGAVYRLDFAGDRPPAWAILGDDRPRGLCGSGLVDLLAGLRRSGLLTATGRFADGRPGYALTVAGQVLTLEWRDVDALQRAKGAIAAGIAILCAQAGLALGDLRRLVAAGLFGRYLDVANAQAIGLLPALPADRVELAGNTALAGAVALLLSREARESLARIRSRVRLLNLARVPAFDDAFLEHLYLQPMES